MLLQRAKLEARYRTIRVYAVSGSRKADYRTGQYTCLKKYLTRVRDTQDVGGLGSGLVISLNLNQIRHRTLESGMWGYL